MRPKKTGLSPSYRFPNPHPADFFVSGDQDGNYLPPEGSFTEFETFGSLATEPIPIPEDNDGLELVEAAGDCLKFRIDGITIEVYGLNLKEVGSLNSKIIAETDSGAFTTGKVDLWSPRSVASFSTLMGSNGVCFAEKGQEYLEKIRRFVLVEQRRKSDSPGFEVETEEEKLSIDPEAMKRWTTYLETEDILGTQFDADMEKLGWTLPPDSRLVLFLGAISSQTEKPIHVLLHGPKGSGKSHSMTTLQGLLPDDQKEVHSRLTPSSLNYLQGGQLDRKVMFVDELVGTDKKAMGQLRTLLETKKLNLLTSVHLPGMLERISFNKEVSASFAMVSSCTSLRDIEPEVVNRFLVVPVQKNGKAVVSGILKARGIGSESKDTDEARRQILEKYQALVSLLTPCKVDFTPIEKVLIENCERIGESRRIQNYLSLVECIAISKQFQRARTPIEGAKEGELQFSIEASTEDVALANRIIAPFLRGEPLSPEVEEFFKVAEAVQNEKGVITRRDLRKTLGWERIEVRRMCERWPSVLVKTRGRERSRHEYQLDLVKLAEVRGEVVLLSFCQGGMGGAA